ncbi:MAG: hypothetical protein HZA28_05050 [Candidatus Omnitrophica bacterium]|nr:hypothetical protein [Candidatus Omnitrophota bacterium]
MSVFLVLVGVSVAGVIAVFFLLRREEHSAGLPLRDLGFEPEAQPVEGSPPAFPLPTKKKEKKAQVVSREEVAKPPVSKNFFARLMPRKKDPASLQGAGTQVREGVPLATLKNFLDEQTRQSLAAATPVEKSAAQQAQLPAEEEERIEQEIDLTARLEEWKEKYARLDKIFQEKSAVLAKNEELLQTELNNRKEFNKLKDILEKELKDTKDKSRIIQVELNGARAEAESYKKRVDQLEEKITKMEKALLVKDDELAGLVKRLEAKPGPAVDAPPAAHDSQVKAPDPILPPLATPVESKVEEPKISDTTAPPVPETIDPPATNKDEQKGGETNG